MYYLIEIRPVTLMWDTGRILNDRICLFDLNLHAHVGFADFLGAEKLLRRT